MFALLDIDGKVKQFLNGTEELKLEGNRCPSQIFTRWSVEALAIHNIVEVISDPKPVYDPITQIIEEIPVDIGTQPKTTWIVHDKTTEEIVAEELVAGELMERDRVTSLSFACRNKILFRYSDTDQSKGMREAIKLVRKETKIGLTPEEFVRADELEAADAWIDEIVAFCRTKIADGTTTVGDLEYVDMEAEPDEDGNYPIVSLWPVPSVSEVTP